MPFSEDIMKVFAAMKAAAYGFEVSEEQAKEAEQLGALLLRQIQAEFS